MNIDKHLITVFYQINNLLPGDCFIFNDIIYMKISNTNGRIENAVNLETGYLTSFNDDTDLYPIRLNAIALNKENN